MHSHLQDAWDTCFLASADKSLDARSAIPGVDVGSGGCRSARRGDADEISLCPNLQEDAYIIGPGDVLDLKLFDAEELSGALEVLNDGSVPLPLVGSVRLSGLTLQQATLWVEQLMSEELLRPELQLRVVKPRPIRVALVGQVERPGIYSLTTSETGQTEGGPAIRLSGLPTVVDAIQKAGGITQNANLRGVVLQRRLPGTESELSYKQAELDLLDLILDGNQSQNPFLFDGDTIRIREADETPEEAVELAAVNLSPQVISVNVIGEVANPGRLNCRPTRRWCRRCWRPVARRTGGPARAMWNWCGSTAMAVPR